LGDPGCWSLSGQTDGWELLGIHPPKMGGETAAAEEENLSPLDFQINPFGGSEGTHQVSEEPSRDGDGPFVFHPTGDPNGDPDLQVGGGEPQTAVPGSQEDVGQDREGGTGGDGPAGQCQPTGEVFLHDGQLHGLVLLQVEDGGLSVPGVRKD
jgi:hypothetical protein